MSNKSVLKIESYTIWITRDKGFNFDKDAYDGVERGEGEELIISLQGGKKLLGQTEEGVQLFSGGETIKNVDVEDTGRKQPRSVRFVERGDDDDDDEMMDDEGFVS